MDQPDINIHQAVQVNMQATSILIL